MTQLDLAESLNLSKGTIGMWENENRKPSYETINELSDIFDRRIDYILGFSDDTSSPKLTEEQINQLGALEVENQFYDLFKSYLQLDEYGKKVAESVIYAEKLRCHEQKTLCDTKGLQLSVRIK